MRISNFLIRIKPKMLKYSWLIVVLLLVSTRAFSQDPSNTATDIKEIPPSPTIWEFEKYGNYPVSMHTGVPNISIPLGSASSGQLQVPISLNYHASGIKVDQKSSWVGLGWTLMTGGAITRTIRGSNDESGYIDGPYYHPGEFNPGVDYSEMEQMLIGTIDTEPDIFNYDFMGYSGKFIFNQSNTKETATVALIPHNDLKVIPDFTGEDGFSFTIITPDGIKAEFGYAENASEYRPAGLIQAYTVTAPSVWYLKKLTAPNGIDVITFTYELVPGYHSQSPGFVFDPRTSDSQSVNYPNPCNLNVHDIQLGESGSGVVYSGVKRIKQITHTNGYVLFNSSANNRVDDPDNEDLRLDTVQFFENTNGESGQLIKSYALEYDYFGSTAGSSSIPDDRRVRLKLHKVYEVASSGLLKNPYVFSYKDSGSERLPPRFSKGQDYWGYYNGKTGNSTLAPRYLTEHPNGTSFYLGTADRDPYPAYTQAGVLEKITYPTLGYTVFEYENNTITIAQAGNLEQHIAGGLRVHQITNYDFDNSMQSVRSYEYVQKDNPSLSSGVYNGSQFITPKDFFSGKPYYYSAQLDSNCSSAGFGFPPNGFNTLHASVSSSPAVAKNYATVFYSEVKEYNGSISEHDGYTWYHYDATKDAIFQGSGPVSFNIDRSWDRGQLLLKETYENGNTTPVSTEVNTYEEIQVQTPISGYKPGTRFNVVSLGYAPPEVVANHAEVSFRNNQYFLTYYTEPIVWKRLVSTVTSQDGVTVTQTFSYDPTGTHTNVTGVLVTDSNQETLETKTYYPDDISSRFILEEGGDFTEAEYQQIHQLKKHDLHRTNTPIQSVTKKNGNVLTIQRNLFDTFDNIVLPSRSLRTVGNHSLEEYIHYRDYIDGRPTMLSRTNGPIVSYLWGYNKEYPIAKIENADYTSIASALGISVTTLENYTENHISQINSLRNLLPQAMITTYEYKPLVGMSSITDSKGYIMKYSYDGFNRLIEVRDSDEKLISENLYHYKNQD